MSSRKTVWRPSDIRDWDRPPAKPSREDAGPAAQPLPADTIVQVRVGRDEWLTKLQWVVDLLSADEIAAVHAAIAERRPMQLAQRPNRAAFVILAPSSTSPTEGT